MAGLPLPVAEEQEVLARVLPTLRQLQSSEGEREKELIRRYREAHAAWTDARGDQAQREAFEEALAEAKRSLEAHQRAGRAREVPAGTPYFARLLLQEGPRRQEVLLGKVGVVQKGLVICDWRDAPISQLYYNYEEGDDYEEEIGGRTRMGELSLRRRVDIRDSVLVEVQGGGGEVFRLRPDGAWGDPGRSRPEGGDDHRLPDIVSLITKEQFQVVTRPEAGVVLLRGRAGSGKTTVALHRIAYLHFQDPRRFRPERMLVVMFNKALQTYISRVLPELGVAGVPVETFHGWAGKMLRSGGIQADFRPGSSPGVARLKRHPAIGKLLEATVRRLGQRSAAWAQEQSPGSSAWEAASGEGLARIAAFRRKGGEPGWWPKLRSRLLDHCRDLWALFEDEALCKELLPRELHSSLPAARRHQAACAEQRSLDYEDAALLLRLGQLKMQQDPDLSCPWAGVLRHLVIDEAQDLSTVEIEALVDATDAGRSVTIAGDPAQKILADAQFEGFEALLTRLTRTDRLEIRLDALAVGHRSTRPIMQLALQALGQGDPGDPAVVAARDGDPVEWVEGSDPLPALLLALGEWRKKRPQSLVAVLAKGKATADQWTKRLSDAGVPGVRRAARGDFSFQPGVVVSNVHQVKGLEFDGVILVEPSDFSASDKHLLHVAITRAAEKLWVVAGKGRGPLT